jgi:hypothetical protein
MPKDLLVFQRNSIVWAGWDADAIKVTFFVIDNRFAVLQSDGAYRAGLYTEAAAPAKFFIDYNFHG